MRGTAEDMTKLLERLGSTEFVSEGDYLAEGLYKVALACVEYVEREVAKMKREGNDNG